MKQNLQIKKFLKKKKKKKKKKKTKKKKKYSLEYKYITNSKRFQVGLR
jgi:hypothetical protein